MKGLTIFKVKADDKAYRLKKGDFVLVDLDYPYDPDKVIFIAKIKKSYTGSMYKEHLSHLKKEDLYEYLDGDLV